MPEKNNQTFIEDFLGPLFNSLTDEVLVIAPDFTIVGYNTAFAKKLSEDMHGKKLGLLKGKSSSIPLTDIHFKAAFSGNEFLMTEEIPTKKGDKEYFELRFVPVKKEAVVAAAAVFIKDVTLFRRAEIDLIQNRITLQESQKSLTDRNQELENTKNAMMNVLEDLQEIEKKNVQKVQQLNAILSSMREALVAVDAKQNIVLLNQTAAALLRLAPGEAMGKSFAKSCPLFIRGKAVTATTSPIKKAIRESSMVAFGVDDGVELKDTSGVMIPLALTSSFLSGDPEIAAIVIMRDITKEKEVDIAKTEIISLASHQLRTPLSSVNWYSEMLLSGDAGPITDDQKNYLTEIYKGNQRMIELVNSLLNVSRIDLGKIMVEPEVVSITDIADGVIADLVPIVQEKKITLLKKVAKDITGYTGDKKIITVTLQNLLSNAVKYTPESGVVNFSAKKYKKGETLGGHTLLQDSVVLTVTDTGYGIPEDDKPKIFSKLYRADNVREKEANGNGLGLYLVKSIIESAEGTVWFTSKENKGSEFYVALPAGGMRARHGATVFT